MNHFFVVLSVELSLRSYWQPWARHIIKTLKYFSIPQHQNFSLREAFQVSAFKQTCAGRLRSENGEKTGTIGHRTFRLNSLTSVGRDSLVGTATCYGLEGPGIESWCGRDFPHPFTPALWHTQPPIQWVPGLCRG
jgi:hypothetical protein